MFDSPYSFLLIIIIAAFGLDSNHSDVENEPSDNKGGTRFIYFRVMGSEL